MQLRKSPEGSGIAVHYNSASTQIVPTCTNLDTVCGVNAIALDRWTTANWKHVTCRRCLRHKRRLERFHTRPDPPKETL